MATASNPFRRKQDLILGIDVSNHTSRPTSQALSRQDTLKSIGGRSLRTVGSIPAGISHIPHEIPEEGGLTPDSDGDRDGEATRFMDIRRETESLFSRGSGEGTYRDTMAMSPESENFDPFGGEQQDEEDEEDDGYDSLDDEFSIYGSVTRSKTVASRRMRALREANSSLRSSSALGYRTGSQDNSSTTGLPSKAERMLGMSAKQQSRMPSAALRPRGSKSKGGLPSKAQRLLGVKSDTVTKSKKMQDKDASGNNIMMMTHRTGSEGDDFRRMLLMGDKGFAQRMGNSKPESTSDTSSISRSSLLESQTSRSSRELLSPDNEYATWAAGSTAPAWIGVHPALRGRKPSSEYDGISPISPYNLLAKDAGYSGKMVVSDFKHVERPPERRHDYPSGPVELDAAPPSPVELPVPDSDMLARSLPDVLVPPKHSSAPSTPIFGTRPMSSKGDSRPADDLLTTSSRSNGKKERGQRPSAIFDDPNIFEMPADTPYVSSSRTAPKPIPSNHRAILGHLHGQPPTPPASDKHGPSANGPSSPLATKSPFPPPSRPLPQPPPQRRKESNNLAILPAVAFDAGRTRKQSEDVPVSPKSPEPKRKNGSRDAAPKSSDDSETSSTTTEKGGSMTNSGYSVPSPLELALAAGKPVTSQAPPPLPSPDDGSEKAAARSDKPRVELSDRDPSRPRMHGKKQSTTQATADDQYRPFSWQSTKTTRSMTMEDEVPPMPPPLALKIPSDAARKSSAAFHPVPKTTGTMVSATPLTATSARSRASRLERALESALSKDSMEKALSGERIEDLFRSAGADELFAMGLGPRTEGLTVEEDDEDAKQAATRAQGLLKDLSALQQEVDELRKLYAKGGPLEGETPPF